MCRGSAANGGNRRSHRDVSLVRLGFASPRPRTAMNFAVPPFASIEEDARCTDVNTVAFNQNMTYAPARPTVGPVSNFTAAGTPVAGV